MVDWTIKSIGRKELDLIVQRCEELIVEYDEEPPSTCNCGVISGDIADQSGGERVVGEMHDLDGKYMGEHCWVELKDGAIIDASIVQFALQNFNIGKCNKDFSGECVGIREFNFRDYPKHMIAIIPPDHPSRRMYSGGE